MNKRGYVALSLANFVVYVVGAGALPLLPVYAAELGASPVLTGYYLAFAYLAVTGGTLAYGWLSDRRPRGNRVRRRALLALTGALAVPATWAMGRAGSVWGLALATALVWFLGGAGMALTGILAGMLAKESERGRAYGVLSLAGGIGTLVGGLFTGPLADRWGYPTMFALLGLFFLLWPLAALLLRDKRADQVVAVKETSTGRGLRLGTSFYLLFAANLVVAVAGFMGVMAQSLRMNGLGYAAAAISSTQVVSGALSLPLPLLTGWLSDRGRNTDRRRKWFLALCYLLTAVGLAALSRSSALWHFWLAVGVMTAGSTIRYALGPALANDLIPREMLGRGLGLFNATNWLGAIVGFAGTGNAVQRWGLAPTLIAGAVLPVISILLLVPVRPARVDPSD